MKFTLIIVISIYVTYSHPGYSSYEECMSAISMPAKIMYQHFCIQEPTR